MPHIFEGRGRYSFEHILPLNAALTLLLLIELHFLLACIYMSVLTKMLFNMQGNMINWTFLQGKTLIK